MRIGIVGAGFVGATTAYAFVMRGIGREIILVDKNEMRAQAEADDVLHAVPFAHALQVRRGSYRDLAGSQVVILSAGVNQQPGETRLQLLERNATVFREIVPQVLRWAPEAILVVATNPVDVMTHLAAYYAAEYNVPSGRVLGSGTMLDTARFRALLGRELGVDAQHVHGYVVGEHGDSEVLTWSLVNVGGASLDTFCRERGICFDEEKRQAIDSAVRGAAYQIIAGKGATYYGIGAALARLVHAILHDQRAVLTVCAPLQWVEDVRDVTLSVPHLVGGNGIIARLPLELDAQERKALRNSAVLLRSVLDQLAGAL